MNDQLKQAIIDGDEAVALALTQALLATGAGAREILDEALLPAWRWSGRACARASASSPRCCCPPASCRPASTSCARTWPPARRPAWAPSSSAPSRATCTTSARTSSACSSQGAGFTVVNLGTGVTAQAFVAAVGSTGPQIVGMSALLTTTLPHMAETIAALKDAGLRDAVKVMVGGAPVTAAYAEEIGADGYGANAGMAVERAKELVG